MFLGSIVGVPWQDIARDPADLTNPDTITALVGDGKPSEQVLSDPAHLGFHVDADALLVSDLTAELLMNYAEDTWRSFTALTVDRHGDVWAGTPRGLARRRGRQPRSRLPFLPSKCW